MIWIHSKTQYLCSENVIVLIWINIVVKIFIFHSTDKEYIGIICLEIIVFQPVAIVVVGLFRGND